MEGRGGTRGDQRGWGGEEGKRVLENDSKLVF